MRNCFARLPLALVSLIALAGCEDLLMLAVGSRPASPSGIEVSDITAGATQLEWRDNATNETSYEVQRLVDGETAYVTVAVVGPDISSYTDTDTESGMVYSYRVRAENEFGTSNWRSSPKISPVYLFPAGDTYGIESFQYDIVSVGIDPVNASITIWFDGPVFPADSPMNGIIGVIEIDVDRNAETGIPPSVDLFGPDEPVADMGVEYSIGLWQALPELNGTYTVPVSSVTEAEDPGIATVVYGETWIRVEFPATEIDFEDGDCLVAIVIGTMMEPTDEAGPMRFR